MASWARQEPRGSSQRRKWKLEDRTSLNNLKHHFAEDGCSEVQYDLAKQLLEDNSENDTTNSHAQGVHWLIQAAQQGHEEAIELLNDCYKNGRGINESNECEVQSILAMSPSERAARKAARELFACLSNGKEYITATQLERRMREIYKLQKKKRKSSSTEDLTDDNKTAAKRQNLSNGDISKSPHHLSQSPNRNGILHTEFITEAHLVSAAINYSNGHLPPVSRALTLSVPHPHSLDHVPCFHRPFFHPIMFFSLLYHHFISVMTSFPFSTISNIQLFVLLFIYLMLASENIIMFIPMGVYYLSLIVMSLATFKMLKTKHEFIDFRIWSGLFLSYGDGNLNSEAPENLFLRKNLKPYLYFFGGFIANLMLQPIVSEQWIPHSEITVVSFFFIFITMVAFMYSSSHSFPDYTILFSFGVNVLAKYPYEMDSVVTTGWRFLDLKVPTFSSFVIGNGIEFCLNCRALLYLLIPGFLIYMAYRRNWTGAYQYLVPHCVTLSWLQICIISSQCSTMFGLVRGALGLAGLLLFLPLFGIVTLLIPVFAVIEWLSLTDPTVRLVVSLFVATMALFGSFLMAANHRTDKYITFCQVMVCVIGTVFFTLPYMTSNFDSLHSETNIYGTLINQKASATNPHDDYHNNNGLTWELYYKYCNQPAWEYVNKIQTQIRCSQLDGVHVKWDGIVTSTEIVKVTNIRSEMITNYLPTYLSDAIKCYFGERNSINCLANENCDDIQKFYDKQRKCNLNNWNSYEYEITIRMQSGILSKPSYILLKLHNDFGNFTQNLNHSDRIWFKGFLKNIKTNRNDPQTINMFDGSNNMKLGGVLPVIVLDGIGCINCKDKQLTTFYITDNLKVNARIRDLQRGFKYLLNVICNPLITFK